MRNILLFLVLFFPLCGSAQVLDADALLDKVVATMKTDSPLQMDCSYSVYDDDVIAFRDKGIMRLDGDRYSLVMDKMGIWCNGVVQWSYMLEVDEVYITDASSDEAQSLSPLSVLENYREGCSKEIMFQDGIAVVRLDAPAGNDIEKIVLYIDISCNRLKGMDVFMLSQGYVKVVLDKYQIKCNFAQGVFECPVEELRPAEVIDMR